MEEKNKDIINIIQILEEKNNLLDELIKFTSHQKDFIKEQEIDKLGRLLESKELRMNKIDELDSSFLNLFEKVKNDFGVEELDDLKLEQNLKKRLQEKTVGIMEKLNKLYEMDQEIQELTGNTHQNLKKKVNKINTGKKVRKGYEKNFSRSDGIFLDKKNC